MSTITQINTHKLWDTPCACYFFWLSVYVGLRLAAQHARLPADSFLSTNATPAPYGMFLGVPSSHALPCPSIYNELGSLRVFVCRGFGDSCDSLEGIREYSRCMREKTSARLGNSIAKVLYLYTTKHVTYFSTAWWRWGIHEVRKTFWNEKHKVNTRW